MTRFYVALTFYVDSCLDWGFCPLSHKVYMVLIDATHHKVQYVSVCF